MELFCTNGVSWGAIYKASDTTAFTVKFCSSSGNVVDYPLAVVVNGGTYTYDDATKEYEKQQKDAYKILNDSKSNNAQRGGAATK